MWEPLIPFTPLGLASGPHLPKSQSFQLRSPCSLEPTLLLSGNPDLVFFMALLFHLRTKHFHPLQSQTPSAWLSRPETLPHPTYYPLFLDSQRSHAGCYKGKIDHSSANYQLVHLRVFLPWRRVKRWQVAGFKFTGGKSFPKTVTNICILITDNELLPNIQNKIDELHLTYKVRCAW